MDYLEELGIHKPKRRAKRAKREARETRRPIYVGDHVAGYDVYRGRIFQRREYL